MTHGSSEVGRTGARSVNQTVALAFGAVYALVAVLGLFVAKTFAGTTDGKLLGLFEVNHLHNIVHLLIGVALLVAARALMTARAANLAIGATYLLVGVLGLFVVGKSVNILALNGGDNLLHLASGALLVGIATAADKARTARA